MLLDVAGGLPFLMAVKPSERTEMAAVYSSFRDVSGILTPGVAWLVLLVAPASGGLRRRAGAGMAVACGDRRPPAPAPWRAAPVARLACRTRRLSRGQSSRRRAITCA